MKNQLLALLIGLTTFFSAEAVEVYYDCCPDDEIEQWDDHGLIVSGEYLWWTIDEGDLDYAIDNGTGNYLAGPGKVHNIDFDWCSGVRMFAAYQSGCYGWEMRAGYTYYSNEACGSAGQRGSGQTLGASLLHPDTTNITNGYECARASNDLMYHVLDVHMTRVFPFLCNTLRIRPFLGLRYLRLEQDIRARYENETVDLMLPKDVSSDDFEREEMSYGAKYSGVGLNLGVEYDHYCCRDFGYYAIASGSIVTGRVTNKHDQATVEVEGGEVTSRIESISIRDRQDITVSGYQIGLGVYAERCLNDCCYAIVKLGYEFNGWWNTPQVRRYVKEDTGISHSSTDGIIGFEGLTLKAEIYF